jgi:hypothetical protein
MENYSFNNIGPFIKFDEEQSNFALFYKDQETEDKTITILHSQIGILSRNANFNL